MPAIPTLLDTASGLPLGTIAQAVVGVASRATDGISQPDEANPESFLDARVRRVQEQEESVESFKEALNDIVEESSESGAPKRPLIFVIDELDRCRPWFALDMEDRQDLISAIPEDANPTFFSVSRRRRS